MFQGDSADTELANGVKPVKTGKELADFLDGFEVLRYDHPEPATPQEAELIGRFVRLIGESDEYEGEYRASYMLELKNVMSSLARSGMGVGSASSRVLIIPRFELRTPVFTPKINGPNRLFRTFSTPC